MMSFVDTSFFVGSAESACRTFHQEDNFVRRFALRQYKRIRLMSFVKEQQKIENPG